MDNKHSKNALAALKQRYGVEVGEPIFEPSQGNIQMDPSYMDWLNSPSMQRPQYQVDVGMPQFAPRYGVEIGMPQMPPQYQVDVGMPQFAPQTSEVQIDPSYMDWLSRSPEAGAIQMDPGYGDWLGGRASKSNIEVDPGYRYWLNK